MMAVLAKADVQMDAILLNFLDIVAEEPLFDPVADAFEPYQLTSYFWKEVERLFAYSSLEPGYRIFYTGCSRGLIL
jgi:hypothetical protein